MPQNRVTMRKIRDILRLAWSCNQTRQSISDSCGIGKTTVTDTLCRASAAGLSYPLPADLDDERLEYLLYPQHPRAIISRRTPPDWASLHNELLTHKNLTLMLLWQEYKEQEPSGYQYCQFCDLFRFWRGKLDLSMRQEHRAGEKMFVDYCGQTKLTGMAQAFNEQMQRPDMASLTFEERFGLLVDHQMTELENRRMQNRLRTAKLRLSASIEDLDFRDARGMNRSQVMSLAQNQWVRSHQNILVTGPTGAGTSYLACALAQKACRDGHTTLYQRLPRLLQDISIARHDGRYQKLMALISKCEVMVLDDLLISPLSQDDQRELLEIVEERYDRKATIVTSQLPIKAWHDAMQDPTLADAILDRLVHNAYKVELKGESMRKKRAILYQKLNRDRIAAYLLIITALNSQ